MGTFTGFSEDDIRKLQTTENKQNDSKDMVYKKPIPNNKKVTFKPTPKIISNDSRNKKVLATKLTNKELPEEAKLNPTLKEKPVNNSVDDKQEIITNNTTIEKKVIDLKEFEIRQKQIEEQNKRRKELLSKALAARAKRTQEEAKKLENIQSELKQLDVDLSNDVKILRQQIDVASMEYMEVQKRYMRIEKEFLDVKLLLHQKLERKEMLTEHLCAIIEKNEERKAVKLTELLNKLQLDDCNTMESKENCSKSMNLVDNTT